ncbi:MAG: alpha/beta fold hydrolase [Bacteroidota bacterium]
MKYSQIREGKFEYLDTGGDGGENIMLLHGLFGGLSNFDAIIDKFGDEHRVIFPTLPMFELPLRKVSVTGLVNHLLDFAQAYDLYDLHLLGNSLGGHVAILFAMAAPERIASVTLTASSGLFENSMGNTYPKRGDREFVRRKCEGTFHDPAMATEELIDGVFQTINNRDRALRVVMTAKSAVRHNLSEKLHLIKVPTLLIWGESDDITPPFVGEKFHELIADSELHILPECGHAPMMELPDTFNKIFGDFLDRVSVGTKV